jgi:hypothetical protein
MENQSAIEWLFSQLWEEPKDKMIWYAILEKAKEMQKKQIAEAYRTGVEEDVYNNPLRTGEDYYNIIYQHKSTC